MSSGNNVNSQPLQEFVSQSTIETHLSDNYSLSRDPFLTGPGHIEFGRNNDSKRMYKFGNADGATISNAIDELRDNSEDAGCSRSETNYDIDKRVFTHYDDGSGMDINTLQEFSNLDSHNPNRDNISTSGQHGIGGPRSLTCIARPEFDDDFKVLKNSSWTVYTKQKGTKKAFSLTCDYIKLNENNRYSDCFINKEYEDPHLDKSYTKIEVPITNDAIHHELINIQDNKSINNLKDNIYVKTAMTYNKPSKINGRDIEVMPNFFTTSDEYISTEYKLQLYYYYDDNTYYPIRIDKVYGDSTEQLGWVNCKGKKYNIDLDTTRPKSKTYADLNKAVATLKLSMNKNRFHIAPNKKGIQACINPNTSPDSEIIEYITPFLDLEEIPKPGDGKFSTFSIDIADNFFKDINVFMETSTYKRCLGKLPFRRGKGLKGSDGTLRHELHSIKKDLVITKSVDKYLKFSREIKSNIDDKLVPKSLLIAINHCICDFKSKVIQTKIKNPLIDAHRGPVPAPCPIKEYVHNNKIYLSFEGSNKNGAEIFTPEEDEGYMIELDADPINTNIVKEEKYITAFISKKEMKYTVEQKFINQSGYISRGSRRSLVEEKLYEELIKIPGVSIEDDSFHILLSSYEQFISKFNNVCRPYMSIN